MKLVQVFGSTLAGVVLSEGSVELLSCAGTWPEQAGSRALAAESGGAF